LQVPDFSANDVFEALIASNGTQDNFDFSIERPQMDVVIPATSDGSTFSFAGMMRSASFNEDLSFSIQIIKSTTKNSESSISRSMKFEKEENDVVGFGSKETYYFEETVETKLEPGLYYYTIIEETEGTVYYTGKFSVKSD